MRKTSLPDGYSTRAPTPEDAATMARLIAASQLADTGEAEMTTDEMLDDWHGLVLSEEAIAVFAPDGEPAGYADVDNHAYVSVSVYGYVHPEHRGRGIGRFLVDWGERWARDHMDRAPEDSRVIVRHYILAENEGARHLLEDSGYASLRGNYVMAIDMEEVPPRPD